MITASEIVSQIVSFLIDKCANLLIGLPFDKRKRACRMLTKLYYSIQSLDEATEKMFETLEYFSSRESTASALKAAFSNHARDIDVATTMFVDLSRELEEGLEILGPHLLRVCYLLCEGKMDFLDYMSNCVVSEGFGRDSRTILRSPTRFVDPADIEAAYQDSKSRPEHIEWPSMALDEWRENFQEVVLAFEDEDAATEVYSMLRRQNKALKDAKRRLRELISRSFSVEEVLFQSNSSSGRI